MGDAFAQLAFPAQAIELVQALPHLRVAEKLRQLLVYRINGLGMGCGHATMLRADQGTRGRW